MNFKKGLISRNKVEQRNFFNKKAQEKIEKRNIEIEVEIAERIRLTTKREKRF